MNKIDNLLNLPLSTRLKKSENVPWRIIEGEAILVNVDKSEVIHLNQTAAEVWNHLDNKNAILDIITHIQEKFEIDEEIAKKDILEFISQLVEKGLVTE